MQTRLANDCSNSDESLLLCHNDHKRLPKPEAVQSSSLLWSMRNYKMTSAKYGCKLDLRLCDVGLSNHVVAVMLVKLCSLRVVTTKLHMTSRLNYVTPHLLAIDYIFNFLIQSHGGECIEGKYLWK